MPGAAWVRPGDAIVDMVDIVLLVDKDEESVASLAKTISNDDRHTELFVLDVTDVEGLACLAERVRDLGTLRVVVHAAGISTAS
ncbi:MAG: hypothetical protein ACRDV7_12890 [Acidimicrobiia bacterium]